MKTGLYQQSSNSGLIFIPSRERASWMKKTFSNVLFDNI